MNVRNNGWPSGSLSALSTNSRGRRSPCERLLVHSVAFPVRGSYTAAEAAAYLFRGEFKPPSTGRETVTPVKGKDRSGLVWRNLARQPA